MKNYQVIITLREIIWVGESDSLHGAKCIAARHREYYDNGRTVYTPSIYDACDVWETGTIPPFGTGEPLKCRTPMWYADPVA